MIVSMSDKHAVRPDERAAPLAAEQNRKMAASAQAYVRGSTKRFYDWLEDLKRTSLPDGPPSWICGDCHVGNLGPVASAAGSLAIQIRDLDQTVIGNPAHDLIRLGLSLAMAARSSCSISFIHSSLVWCCTMNSISLWSGDSGCCAVSTWSRWR